MNWKLFRKTHVVCPLCGAMVDTDSCDLHIKHHELEAQICGVIEKLRDRDEGSMIFESDMESLYNFRHEALKHGIIE